MTTERSRGTVPPQQRHADDQVVIAVPPAPRPLPAAPLAGASMLAGAACLALAEALHVEVGGEWSTEAMLESLATRPERWLLWSLLLMAMALLTLPGVVAWRSRVVASGVRRGRGLTTVGTVVLGASLVALFGFGASHADAVAMVDGTTPVPQELVDAYTRADASVGVALTAGIGLLGFHLGVPLFLAGLARAGSLSWRVALPGMVAGVASFVVGDLQWYLGVAAFAVVAAVLGYLGVRLLVPTGAG